jgi:TRAP-type C4-dicarboxylate transport system permease small subunit
LQKVEKLLNYIGGGLILTAMMILVTCDVVGRFIFNHPIHGVTEITEFLMVGMFYFTLAHTQAVKHNIKVEVLITHLSDRGKQIAEFITYFLGLLLFILITWQGVRSAADAWAIGEITFGLVELPLFPAKVLVPIGSFMLCLRFLVDIIEGWRNLKGGAA